MCVSLDLPHTPTCVWDSPFSLPETLAIFFNLLLLWTSSGLTNTILPKKSFPFPNCLFKVSSCVYLLCALLFYPVLNENPTRLTIAQLCPRVCLGQILFYVGGDLVSLTFEEVIKQVLFT